MNAGEMQYRALGRCGTRVSAFGLGGWTTYGGSLKDDTAVQAILRAALDAGINFFDIADVYAYGEAERVMGRALADVARHELVLSSKVFFPMSDDVNDRGLSRKHIMESVERSLRNIGSDYLDIYFCHRFDRDTPMHETARAMDDLVRQGKVIYWGTSEWSGDQLRHAHALCSAGNMHPPQVEQPQYSLLARGKFEHDVQPAAEALGMGLVTWSPLYSGVLSGKYDDGLPGESRLGKIEWLREKLYTESNLDKVRRFKPIAEKVGCSRACLALAWAVSRPGVSSVILGATRVEQLCENLAALRLDVSADALAELEALFPSEKPRGGPFG
jgi:voltage-dependent potassium channel beta subunit